MLVPVDHDLWTVTRPHSVYGLTVNTRMTVVRLETGLWVHSPVPLLPDLQEDLDRLGPVRYLVAPNRMHHLYLDDYVEAYPGAEVCAAPGLPKKRTDILFQRVLSDRPPLAWQGALDQLRIHGFPRLNEVVFHHRPSRTLIVTDLVMHITRNSPAWVRYCGRAMGLCDRLAVPPSLRWLFLRDREAARRSLTTLLDWDFERVLMSHGVCWEQDGKTALRDAYQWLLPVPPAAPA